MRSGHCWDILHERAGGGAGRRTNEFGTRPWLGSNEQGYAFSRSSCEVSVQAGEPGTKAGRVGEPDVDVHKADGTANEPGEGLG